MILCVGESLEQRKAGKQRDFVEKELEEGLKNVKKNDMQWVAIAYEPIWAIGKHALRAASTDDALEVAILIKKTLMELYSKEGGIIPILYGGSVDAKNAWEFLTKSHVDGLLVGRASLDPKIFGEILKNADSIK